MAKTTIDSERGGAGYYFAPPDPPYRFWLTSELKPLQERIDAGETLNGDEYVEYSRLRGREDLYYFAKKIMGFDWLEWELHGPLAYAWQAPEGTIGANGKKYGRVRMALVPRGHLKTSLCTQAYAAWRLVRNPEERILIYTTNFDFASNVMGRIKSTFEGAGNYGQFFLACYGDLIPPAAKRGKDCTWTATELTILRQDTYTDPSIKASGVGATLTGGHFTLQLVDDIVGDELSREQMQKVIAAYDKLTPMYHSLKDGERRIVGTHWGFYDPYVYIHRYSPNALVARRSWLEDGKLIFSRCDVEEALSLKRRNPFFFACQYECWPKDEEKMGFRQSWFRYFRQRGDYFYELNAEGKETRKTAKADCNFFILIDPNTGRAPGQAGSLNNQNAAAKAKNDYVGIVVVGVNKENMWFIPRVVRWRYNPKDFVDKVFELVGIWSPKFVAIEQVAAQRLFVHIFNEEWKKGRPMFVLRDWQGGHASKEERIKGLIPRYANGFILHRDAEQEAIAQGIAELEGELLDFPHAEYDDASDALSAGIAICYPPGHSQLSALRSMERTDQELAKLDPTAARVWRNYEKGKREQIWGQGEFYSGDWAQYEH